MKPYTSKFSGKGKTVTYPQWKPKFTDGGNLPASQASHKGDPFSPQATLRRSGYVQGWDEVARNNGVSTFQSKQTNGPAMLNFEKTQEVNPKAFSTETFNRNFGYDMLNNSQGSGTVPKAVRNVLGFGPGVQNVKYGQINYAQMPGALANNIGVVGDAYQFENVAQPQPQVNTELGTLPPYQTKLQGLKHKGLPNVLYTPDGMSTAQFMNSIRQRNANNKAYNKHADIVNMMTRRYNQSLEQPNPNSQYAALP